jgi:hypothetical protein
MGTDSTTLHALDDRLQKANRLCLEVLLRLKRRVARVDFNFDKVCGVLHAGRIPYDSVAVKPLGQQNPKKTPPHTISA